MAREQRYDVDYFPHQCIHGRKMHIIETKFGNDGYATWFKLLEQLGKANYHYLDISDEMNLMFLVSIFKVSEEKALLILGTLAKLEAIDKFLYEEHQIIYSQKFAESVKDAYRKRKSEILQYSDLLTQLNIKTSQSGGSLTQEPSKGAEVIPKEKKSKEKERKEENIGTQNFDLEAYDFLKKELPEDIEIFEMQNKKSFPDYKKFIQNFNSKATEEKLEFDANILKARLKRMNSNWDKSPKNIKSNNGKLTGRNDKYS